MVHANTAVFANFSNVVFDQADVFRFAVRRQAHYFVFAAVNFEAGVISEGAVKQTEAVRKAQLFQQSNFVAAADADRTRGPFAHAIDS